MAIANAGGRPAGAQVSVAKEGHNATKVVIRGAIWGALPWEQVRDADDKRVDADTHWAVPV